MTNPVVLITGASRGLGKAIALAFARHRYAIGLNYLKNDSEADQTAQLIGKEGGESLLLKYDIRDSRQVNEMVAATVKKWGRIDVLINNAGVARNKKLIHMTDEDWREVMSVILDGTFFCTRAVLPVMREKKEGSIVNISSYLAYKGMKGAANYTVAKAGLLMLTKNTALEEGFHNIRVNAVLPGYHTTDMNRDIWEKVKDLVMSSHLLGRLQDKDEMAEFVVKVAEMKSVTGQVFPFESRLI
ncbi:MAG: SDR family oxidoreductase [Elusimicrobia bacterium]|nr:SDR family oxidoreductase [Candidatus Obscuribacterium magneticum]